MVCFAIFPCHQERFERVAATVVFSSKVLNDHDKEVKKSLADT